MTNLKVPVARNRKEDRIKRIRKLTHPLTHLPPQYGNSFGLPIMISRSSLKARSFIFANIVLIMPQGKQVSTTLLTALPITSPVLDERIKRKKRRKRLKVTFPQLRKITMILMM
jgi:hypothetical protein